MVFVDQITKFFANLGLNGKNPFVIIQDVFELHYLENQSAAFGVDLVSIIQKLFKFSYFENNPDAFLKAKMIFFVVLTLVVVILVAFWYTRIPASGRMTGINIVAVLFVSGAIGNLIDRIVHNYVIDFFYFKLIDFPIFNVADIYVTLSVALFIILILFYYKDEDYKLFSPFEKDHGNS